MRIRALLSLFRSLSLRVAKEEARSRREKVERETLLSLTMPFFDLNPSSISLFSLSLFLSLQARRPHPPHPRHPAPAARRGLRGAAGRFSAAAGEGNLGTEGGRVSFLSFVSLRPFALSQDPFSLSFPSLSRSPSSNTTRTPPPTSSSSRTPSTLSPSASSRAF